MSVFILSCWSCLIIFVWMVHSKYRNTAPNYAALAAFLLAGVCAGLFAGWFNFSLTEETRFTFESPNLWHNVICFVLGAGLGEEFWKMGAGLLVVLMLAGLHARIGDTGRILGFVTLALGFATFENLLSYSADLDFVDMVRRGLMAVPFHAAMGMIHGLAVNRALRRGSAMPLLLGYLAAALLHALYDTVNLFVRHGLNKLKVYEVWPDFQVPPEFTVGPIVGLLALWFIRQWRRLPELTPEPAEPQEESWGENLP